MNKLDPKVKIDIEEILKDLEHYHPRRKGWTWREKPEGGVYKVEKFEFKNMTLPLKNSVPLPAAKYSWSSEPQVRATLTGC
jgi:D-ornithine 4,5-aminomutase subunit beta